MHRAASQTSIANFSFQDMPLLDEDFDADTVPEQPEMLFETIIHCIGESDEF